MIGCLYFNQRITTKWDSDWSLPWQMISRRSLAGLSRPPYDLPEVRTGSLFGESVFIR